MKLLTLLLVTSTAISAPAQVLRSCPSGYSPSSGVGYSYYTATGCGGLEKSNGNTGATWDGLGCVKDPPSTLTNTYSNRSPAGTCSNQTVAIYALDVSR